jgi:hypothetical protein
VSLPAVTRPNGKLYRPRKLHAVLLNVEDNRDEEVVVLGTHDVLTATVLAVSEVDSWDFGFEPADPVLSWYRQSIRNGDPFYEYDEIRGAACVVFQITEKRTW